MKKVTTAIVIGIIIYFSFLLISRDPLITDDLTPNQICDSLIKRSELVYVIPIHNNNPLTDYPEWCAKMRSLNKTFALHGIYHTYHEFVKPINKEEFNKAIEIFEQCLQQKPKLFRPPYNKISKENQELAESLNLTIYNKNYFFHPYCHCQPKSIVIRLLNLIIGC